MIQSILFGKSSRATLFGCDINFIEQETINKSHNIALGLIGAPLLIGRRLGILAHELGHALAIKIVYSEFSGIDIAVAPFSIPHLKERPDIKGLTRFKLPINGSKSWELAAVSAAGPAAGTLYGISGVLLTAAMGKYSSTLACLIPLGVLLSIIGEASYAKKSAAFGDYNKISRYSDNLAKRFSLAICLTNTASIATLALLYAKHVPRIPSELRIGKNFLLSRMNCIKDKIFSNK